MNQQVTHHHSRARELATLQLAQRKSLLHTIQSSWRPIRHPRCAGLANLPSLPIAERKEVVVVAVARSGAFKSMRGGRDACDER